MKIWYLELRIDEELDDKLKKLAEATGEDDEEVVLKALKEYLKTKSIS
ncbi:MULTISPECIES: ribbon-helix-helix protein, CopG family [unclassified Exiguobacterium]|nr:MULTISPECIES: ribbon-helix-helix protein, CopG family [unclassified Exiguobacterium]